MNTKTRVPLNPARDSQKFRELILYIATRCETEPQFGMTRLYKALFYADFRAYIETGRSITDHVYVRGPYGPLPDDIDEVIGELRRDRDAEIDRRTRHGYQQHRLVALRDPQLELFSAREIAVVDAVLSEQQGMSAWSISEQSHREILGWQAAAEGEQIPYESSWVIRRPLTPEQMAYGMQLVIDG